MPTNQAPTNQALAEALSRIAQLMDLLGEDSFKSSAHARAARAIESLAADLRPIATGPDPKAARAQLMAIEGIGQKIADKTIEFFATGRIRELDELSAKVPAGLVPLLSIQGVGPKTARALWQTLKVESLADLKRVIADGSILTLPRMGEKAVEKMKQAIALAEEGDRRLWLGQAMPIAERIVAKVRGIKGVIEAAYAGSLRRGRETIGDIDVLATVKSDAAAKAVTEAFTTMPGVTHVLASGPTRSSVRFATSPDWGRWTMEGKEGQEPAGPSVQVDLKLVPPESWGAALLYFTGSKDHNIQLRERALARGLTLNEYGLYPDDKDATPPHQRGVKAVASRTERDIYEALGLVEVPPEIREASGELSLPAPPRLVELDDTKAELHAHTTASDGTMSIEELASRAKERGFHTIAITDHSQSSTIAGGLKPDRLRQHVEAIRRAQEKFLDRSGRPTIRLLAGSEVDILADGTLDYADTVLALLDLVVASPHAALTQDPETATKRLLAAIAHPRVHILGHPTGRLISRRAGLSPDMGELIAAAKASHVALEVNAHWLRLDLRDTHVRAAVKAGCLVTIDCDVHTPEDFDNLVYGVKTARRGWLTHALCPNAWSAAKLREWVESKHAR